MDFSTFDVTYPLLAIALILVLLLQSWLIRQRQVWLGAMVPALGSAALVYFAATGSVLSVTDFIFAALGLMGLMAWWAGAGSNRAKVEDDRRSLFTPQTAVDSRVSFPPPGTGVHRQCNAPIG